MTWTREARIGHHISILKHQLPNFFSSPFQTQIYSKNILFIDPFQIKIQGKFNYAMYMNVFKWNCKAYFNQMEVSILSLQFEQDQLKIRWSFNGVPRSLFYAMQQGIPCSYYEGRFLYEFDGNGYISEHHVVRLHPLPTPTLSSVFFRPLPSGFR